MALFALGSCDQWNEGGNRDLLELERMAFVPGSEGPNVMRLANYSRQSPLLVDRFELTRGDCRDLGVALGELDLEGEGAASSSGFVTDGARLAEEVMDWPAYVTFAQAVELAKRRDMRLPTPNEWLHVATNGGRQLYPYHATTPQKGYANTLDLGLGRPAPVGSFENGRSEPFGCYDLLGNVWEWVDGIVPGHTDPLALALAISKPGAKLDDRLTSAMGGSYLSNSRLSFTGRGGVITTYNAKILDKRDLLPDVGVRHVADAEAYLMAHGNSWGDDAESRERVRQVGAAWAAAVGRGRVASFLRGLLKSEGAPKGLRDLLEGADPERAR